MKDIDRRLENILHETEKMLSLQGDLTRQATELKSINQDLKGKIKVLEEEILKLQENNELKASEQQKINNQKQKEITDKINELLSEVDRCISRVKMPGKIN